MKIRQIIRDSIGVLVTIFALCPVVLAQSQARDLLPQTFSDSGQNLQLVSCGVRNSLWIDHYAAGLYLPAGVDMQALMDASQPKGVLIRMITTRYMPDQIPGKWLEALERETPSEPLSGLRRAYRRLSEGDVMSIVYQPATGITTRVNGSRVSHVANHRVIRAILDAWAEERPIFEKLQKLSGEHRC